ncbi:MAG: hypothetical protein WAP47_08825 [Candidatus Rokuibacteriota bacterium]
MAASTDNYYVGKAIITFKKTGAMSATDLGNIPECEFSFNIEKLDHFSSRAGVKSKDKSVIISKSATIRLVMEEITAENMALALGGTVTTNSDGSKTFGLMTDNTTEGELTITGTNEIGNQVNWVGDVSFAPSGSFNPISDEWGSVEATCEVLVDGYGNFGLFTVVPQAT